METKPELKAESEQSEEEEENEAEVEEELETETVEVVNEEEVLSDATARLYVAPAKVAVKFEELCKFISLIKKLKRILKLIQWILHLINFLKLFQPMNQEHVHLFLLL